MRKLRGNTKSKVQNIVALHDEMQNCYFWSPPNSASARRAYEKRRSNDINFRLENRKYCVVQSTDCSCKNIYYKLFVSVDGTTKNVKVLRKII